MPMNRRDKILPCSYWRQGLNTGNLIPCYCTFDRKKKPIPIFKWQICRKVKFEKNLLLSFEHNSKIISGVIQ
jgi:hypothetical protein